MNTKHIDFVKTRVPNEVAAQKVNITVNEDGTVSKEYGEVLHIVRPMTEEEGKLNDELIGDNSKYNSKKTVDALAKKLGKENVVDSKEQMNNRLQEFIGKLPVMTFKGTDFDMKIAGLSNAHYDLQKIATEFKEKNQRSSGKGTQTDFHKYLVGDKTEVKGEAHQAVTDIQMAAELGTEMLQRLYKEEIAGEVIELMMDEELKLGAKKDSDYLVEVDLKPEEVKEISVANKKYLEENGLELIVGTEFEYNPDTGDITVIDKSEMDEAEYEVYLAHEIRHRMTYNWLLDNKDSADVKYLTRAIDKVMKDVFIDTTIEDMNLWRRLEYMKDQKNDIRKTAEIVAILSTEPNIRETFIKHFPQKQQSRLQEIMQILMDVLGTYSNPKYVINMVDNIVAKTDTTKENDAKIHKQELRAEVEEFADKLGISKEMAKTILDISEDCE
jgi:hypothetical protein